MKKIRFTKMHGAGNDFVLVDDRDLRLRIVKNKDKSISWELDDY